MILLKSRSLHPKVDYVQIRDDHYMLIGFFRTKKTGFPDTIPGIDRPDSLDDILRGLPYGKIIQL